MSVEVRICQQVADIPPEEQAALLAASIVAYDVETTGLDPMDRSQEMLGIGLSVDPGRGYYLLPGAWSIIGRMQAKKSVAHNGKFDNQWLWRYDIHMGQTFDTMLAAYLLDENRPSFKLERLAVDLLGVEPYHTDTEEMLSDGQAAEIPVEVLGARCARDAAYTLGLYLLQRDQLGQDKGLARVMQHILMPVSRLLERVEAHGLPLDLDLLAERHALLKTEIVRLRAEVLAIGGEDLNPNSSPQLATVLFEQLGLPIIKRTKGGKPSTDKDTLAALRERHPFVTHLLDYRKCAKADTAYYTRWKTRQRDGVLRGSFWVVNVSKDRAGTRTGRLSGDLQQVPKQFKNTPVHLRLKDLVVAPAGHVLLEADYSQIELRMAAWLAEEQAMRQAYQEGRDLHIETARDVLGVEHPTESDRSKAKPVNFGFLFKMSAKHFQEYALKEYGIRFTLEECEEIRKRYFRKFPGLLLYYWRREQEVRRTLQVRGPFGQIRRLPNIRIPDKSLQWDAIAQAINTPIQQAATHLLFLASVEIEARLRPLGVNLVNLVHDSILLLCPTDTESFSMPRLAANTVKDVMEKWVPEAVERMFGVTIPVPLEAEVKAGRSWGSLILVDKLAESVR